MLGVGLDLSPQAVRAVRGTAPAPSLDLNFMYGVLPAGVTFARASTADYTDVGGVARTAAIDEPRLTAAGLMVFDAAAAGAVEYVTLATLSPWFSEGAGTIVAEFSVPAANTGVAWRVWELAGTTNSFRLRNASGQFNADGNAGATMLSGTVAAGLHKVAVAFSSGSNALSVNGAAPASSALVPDTAGSTSMKLGNRIAGDRSMNGYLRRLRVFQSRLSNDTLQALTA